MVGERKKHWGGVFIRPEKKKTTKNSPNYPCTSFVFLIFDSRAFQSFVLTALPFSSPALLGLVFKTTWPKKRRGLWTRMLFSFLVMRNGEEVQKVIQSLEQRVTRKKGYGEKIISRMSLSCISFFRLAVEIGACTRIKFKSLWTFSFCAPFVFLELLWFTSLVSFTGSYIEDKPKFFCDCPTDVSLRSLLPTCFLFLSSFFPLPGIY